MIKIKISNSQINHLLIYFALLLFSGFYFCEQMTTLAVIVVGALVFLRIHRISSVDKKTFSVFLCMILIGILSQCLSAWMYQDTLDSKLLLLAIINLCLALGIAVETNMAQFKRALVNVMVAIAISSLVLYVVVLVDPSQIKKLPELINSKNRSAYFAVFTIVSDFSHTSAQRNQGIFWEPGAFQAFLALAYIFELSAEERQPRKWVLLLFLISIVTTVSTTGIIVGVLLVAFTLSRKKGRIRIMHTVAALAVVAVCAMIVLPRLTGYWAYAIIGKLQLLFDYQEGMTTAASSRMDSVVYPLKEFMNSPLWGIGNAGYAACAKEAGHSMFTCTPVNWIVENGLIYGGLIYCGLWKFFKKLFANTFETFIILAIFLVSISTEAFQGNVIFLAMCFAGYLQAKNKTSEVGQHADHTN